MQFRQLGKSGLRVSCLGFGTDLNIGHSLGEAESREMVRTAFDAGVNLFDCADGYSNGAAERMLGKCLAEFHRSDFVLLTKVGSQMGDGPNHQGLSAKHIAEACDASLRRLGLGYVDLYLCHRKDPGTPLEETVRAMGGLVGAGKARYWGVSNWPATRVVHANAIARSLGLPAITVCEDRYNLLYRWPESLLFPSLIDEGIGVVSFSPLGHGMLAGIYKPGETAASPGTRADMTPENPVTKYYYSEENRQRAAELVRIADGLGTTAAVLATAWCLTNPAVSAVLQGAWTLPELEQNIEAADLDVPPETRDQLEALFPLTESIPAI